MNAARLLCLSMLLLALVQEKTVNLVSLSLAFQGVTQPESSYRRIKRFFTEMRLDKIKAAHLILRLLPPPPYTICADRTNWQFGSFDINILVIAIVHRGIAFPIVWSFLSKQGNSSSDERIDLLQNFLELVAAQDIAFFLTDREFIGVTWFNYLDKRRIPFAIRIRKDSLCDNWCSVYALFAYLPLGDLKILNNSYSIYGCKVRVVGMKLAHNDYAIIATNRSPAKAFIAYKLRWTIEMLFSALKTTGFNIEATHLTQAYKLDTLFTLLAIAFA
ncbi:MAG: IS4 family transposase [Deinococcota bacterium]